MQKKCPISFREFQISHYILYKDSVICIVSSQTLPFFIVFVICIKITHKNSAAKLPMFGGSLGTVATIGSASDCI